MSPVVAKFWLNLWKSVSRIGENLNQIGGSPLSPFLRGETMKKSDTEHLNREVLAMGPMPPSDA